MSFSITIKDERGPCFQPSWRFDFKEPLIIKEFKTSKDDYVLILLK